jgi:hypothetical protein
MSLFSPVPFSVHTSVPPDLMVAADAAVYVATSPTVLLAPCTVLKPVFQFFGLV